MYKRQAVDIVDEIIATIRACKGGFAEARQAVMDNFGFDELQADAIVKLQLGRLAGLEILKIEQELGELREAIADYEDILANDEHVKRIVKTDLTALADKYGDERRTSCLLYTSGAGFVLSRRPGLCPEYPGCDWGV